jgi:hypothetical protein
MLLTATFKRGLSWELPYRKRDDGAISRVDYLEDGLVRTGDEGGELGGPVGGYVWGAWKQALVEGVAEGGEEDGCQRGGVGGGCGVEVEGHFLLFLCYLSIVYCILYVVLIGRWKRGEIAMTEMR